MKTSGKCPKCSATEILNDALAIDRGHGNARGQITVGTIGQPDAFLFKDLRTTSLSAWVCAKCGFVEFYADDPAKIRLPRD